MRSIPQADEAAMRATQHAMYASTCQAREVPSSRSPGQTDFDRSHVDALFLETRTGWCPTDILRAEYALRCARLTRHPVIWWVAQAEAHLKDARSSYSPKIVIVTAAAGIDPYWVSTAALFASRNWTRAAVAVLVWPGFPQSKLDPRIHSHAIGRSWPRRFAEAADLVDL